MKDVKEIKKLIKKICVEHVLVDHDLNITILKSDMRNEFRNLVKNFDFIEMNRVVGYFLDELEGTGIELTQNKLDNPDLYLIFCINECEQTLEAIHQYVDEFKLLNSL